MEVLNVLLVKFVHKDFIGSPTPEIVMEDVLQDIIIEVIELVTTKDVMLINTKEPICFAIKNVHKAINLILIIVVSLVQDSNA